MMVLNELLNHDSQDLVTVFLYIQIAIGTMHLCSLSVAYF